MTAGEPLTTPAPRQRLKKRVVIPAVILGITLAVFAALWIRGTVASTSERNPGSPADGVLTQLLLTAEGRKVVRCAAVLDCPVAGVWKAVTYYDDFEKIFPTVKAVKSSLEADGRYRFACDVTSILGTWRVDIRIRHQEAPEKHVASWDDPSGDVIVNRGSWTLLPAPGDKTLVAYTLDVEVHPFPNFLVRAVLLARQRTVVEALKSHIDKQRQ